MNKVTGYQKSDTNEYDYRKKGLPHPKTMQEAFSGIVLI